MRYALLICADEALLTPETGPERMEAFEAFQQEMADRGVLLGGERLTPVASATTVRVRQGDLVIADGPFAETKEQIAGFYLVDCKDLDEAIEVAAKIPAAEWGSVEIRPIWEM
ncbi:MAG TPA: YciI family protein [Acidimicrobiales bacterium]|nr:YciI family protein [Acidimicrobiales bacterium]